MDHVIYKGEKFKVSIIYQYSGLERIPLKHLELRKRGINSISEIEGLSQLKELQSLNLWGNNITEIKGLEELSTLERLYLGANQISEIKGIEGLIRLTHLSLGDKISEIKGLEKLINLTHLTLGRNISEIKNLANLKNLRILDLSKNQISEIKGLELLTNIVDLDLSSNQISEIKELSTLRKLSSLDLSNNMIEEIKGLEGLKKISNLNLRENKITEIKSIDSLPNLRDLDLAHNQITSVKEFENLPECIIHLYSNPIPEVEMKKLYGYVNGSFVVHSQTYGNQILTIFNNSHEKIHDNSYEFSIYCRNIDGKLPNPNFELKLHLINPKGRALQPFRMNLHPSDLQHPDYDSNNAVKFHISIDLNTLSEEEGLWHYFFTLKDESNKDKLIYIPENGYIRGPETSSPGKAVYSWHSVSSIPGKRYNRAGFMKNDYEFIVNFFYSKELKDVYLCLIPSQKTDGIGISNTVGIKKFNMKLVKPESNYLDEGGFRCIINFENLGYEDAQLGWFYHYYEGILKDGTKAFFGQLRSFYSEHEDAEFSQKEIWEDFQEPFVASNHPQLVDYLFEDRKHLIYSPSFFFGEIEELLKNDLKTEYQVKSNYNLRFEVLYADSKGDKPIDGYPRLFFRNKELDKKFEYTMFPNKSFLTQLYGDVFDSYICDVNWAHIPKGIWNFYFEAKNSKGNLIKNLLGKEKFLRI